VFNAQVTGAKPLQVQLANDGSYSEAERNGFSLLHLFYSDRLASFQILPRFGEESEFYENPKFWADQGIAAVGKCKPGDANSQQPAYDAANSGGDSLEAVTNSSTLGQFQNVPGNLANALTGFQGALLTKRDLS
jgi:hypothetical protein